jgi:dTDP-glucose 4,6-dehydratase
MKLLVTGGAGFIGSNFILYWMKNHPEDSIINIDKLTYAGNLLNLKSIEKNVNYRFVQEDICNKKAIFQYVKDTDIIVHFAAETHVDRSIVSPDSFIQTNVVGTYTLLELAREFKIGRFHHISTDEVFGSLPLGSTEKFDEHTKYDPRSPYSASKAASDHLVNAYYTTYNLPITISNCSNNFGPFQFPEKFISLAIINILENKKVPIYGDGLYVRDWLYVEDHCRAIDLILRNGKIGETYCVGGLTDDISNIEVINLILRLLDKKENLIEFVHDRPGHDRRYAISWKKIKDELGWEPQHDFTSWLKETIQWYIKNKTWWQNVKRDEYHKMYEQ